MLTSSGEDIVCTETSLKNKRNLINSGKKKKKSNKLCSSNLDIWTVSPRRSNSSSYEGNICSLSGELRWNGILPLKSRNNLCMIQPLLLTCSFKNVFFFALSATPRVQIDALFGSCHRRNVPRKPSAERFVAMETLNAFRIRPTS